MAHNRRDRRMGNKCVVLVTNRVLYGLPFVPRKSVKQVLLGILAKAQNLYHVEICGFVFMGNHYHMVLKSKACKLSPFMNYVNGEIAKAFRRLTGRYRGKFWQGRYKEQKLATPIDVLRALAYIYSNPTRAGLVSHPKDYPGLISYNLYQVQAHWTKPSKLKKLQNEYSTKTDEMDYLHVRKNFTASYVLRIEPFAWVRCFKERCDRSLLEKMLEEQLNVNFERFLGSEKLINQRLDKHWEPKSKGKTPFIICHDEELRKILIADYRAFVAECRKAWELFKQGYQVTFPGGCYSPPQTSRSPHRVTNIYQCWQWSGHKRLKTKPIPYPLADEVPK